MLSEKPTKQIRQKFVFLIAIIILVFLRFLLSNRLPIYIISDLPHDDAWIVTRAIYFLQGEWMGPYNQYTLIKGVFSPLLLAVSIGLGVTFQGLNIALYCFSCVIFLIAISPTLKRKWIQLLCLAILLFNPITYALQTGQRVYRNGLCQWQLMLIFGCTIAMLLRRKSNWKCLLKWGILDGLALGAFVQTREDYVWIYPFVLVSTIVMIIMCLNKTKKISVKIFTLLVPIMLTILSNGMVGFINNIYYGAPIINDRDSGNYAKVMQDLYLISSDPKEDKLYQSDAYQHLYYNIYTSTVEKAMAVSPTLSSAAQPIRNAIAMWANWDGLHAPQPIADHILFAIRDGVKGAGYYQTLPKTEAFYGKVHKELQVAFKNGTLKKRGISISAMAAPLEKGDIAKTVALLNSAVHSVVNFDGVSSAAVPANGSSEGIETFQLLAGGGSITKSVNTLTCSGWAFTTDDNINLKPVLYDSNKKKLLDIDFVSGLDVYKYFLSKGIDCKNAKMCRFSFFIDGYDLTSGLVLRFIDKNGSIYQQIPMDGSTAGGNNGVFNYAIDTLKAKSSSKKAEEFYGHYVNRANAVINVYQKTSPCVSIIACILYIFMTIKLAVEFFKKQERKMISIWLFLTGVLLSLILFLLCMCYMTATTFDTLFYLYLSPAYILYLMFCTITFLYNIEYYFDYCKIVFNRHVVRRDINKNDF